ncbi:MAG: AraC family transcriptional regulator, partial [Clostridia bacterium]|nr:AraC family transcriptional regulator [Clostridia bacterium]
MSEHGECGLERINPERIGLYGFYELNRKSYREAEKPAPFHVHPDSVEVCYVHRGMQHCTVGHRTYTLLAGDVLLTYPGERHSGGGYIREKGSLHYSMIVDTVNGLDRFIGLSRHEGPALAAVLAGLPRRFHAGYRLKRLFDAMLQTYQESASLAPLLMRSQFCLLADQLSRAAMRQKSPKQADIQHIVNVIEERLPNVPKIGELADMAHLTESYFKQKFRQEMGIPPAKYIVRRRIALSQRLLLEGVSITDIAF